MTSFEQELVRHISEVKTEVEAQAWNIENRLRRQEFLSRRFAAVAINDGDPLSDESLDLVEAA